MVTLMHVLYMLIQSILMIKLISDILVTILHSFSKLCMYGNGGHMHLSTGVWKAQKYGVILGWSYTQLGTARSGCSESNSGPLQEQCDCLTFKMSLQPYYIIFIYLFFSVSNL